MKKKVFLLGLFLLLGFILFCTYEVVASPDCNVLNRRGCCSHHGGVCGCSGGRAVCCDGSFSPSCGCY
jgi:hypothetical protein